MALDYLSNRVKLSIASTTTLGAAAATTITSSAVDMTGYEGCLFIIPLGTIVSGAVTSVKLTQCDTTGGSYADLVGSGQTIADTDDDKCVFIDCRRPQEGFLKVVVSRATQNATIGGIFALQYGKRNRTVAITQGTGVTGEQFQYVAEGTA